MNATTVPLNPQQTESAERIFQTLLQAAQTDLRSLAQLLASKPDDQLLGRTEFEVRDLIHGLGAKALQAALNERKKGGTVGPASPVPAATTPASSATDPRGWSACWDRFARRGLTTTVAIVTTASARATPCWD
jgi:hypothetical protein